MDEILEKRVAAQLSTQNIVKVEPREYVKDGKTVTWVSYEFMQGTKIYNCSYEIDKKYKDITIEEYLEGIEYSKEDYQEQ